jgi:RNA polymerase sigma factor (sigma-70 family)
VKPLLAAAATEASDDQLVAAVREGSEEAFEALYRRYRPRIVGYVRSMCSDHARAEDVAQDAFMSALRGLRSSDKEIAFRPWLYEIAKNACIDHMRRAGRSPEVSIDSEDFSPQEEGRISQSVAPTDAEVTRREELESLQMAFGDLPQSQHEILVMREFEGLSYDRIGRRMGLSRGAVESLLFRARRTLRDGFDDIDTGERCVRMRVAMEAMADGHRTGMRDRRRMSIHLRDCAGCRRTAVAIGLDDLALAAARERGSALRRVAGLLPLPAFLRRRLGDGLGGLNSSALNAMVPAAEQGFSLTGKAAALVVAAALAAGGAGVVNKASGGAVPLPGGMGVENEQAASHAGGGPGGTAAAPGAGSVPGVPAGAAAGAPGVPAGGGGAGRGPGGTRTDGHTGGPAGSLGLPLGLGGTGAGAQSHVHPLSGLVGGATGPAGQLTDSAGKVIDRTGKRVTDLVGGTVQNVTGAKPPKGSAPKVTTPSVTAPEVSVPKVRVPKVSVPRVPGTGIGGGGPSRKPSVPDAGGTVRDTTSKLPVQTPQLSPVQAPTVTLPETGVTLPAPGVRLP